MPADQQDTPGVISEERARRILTTAMNRTYQSHLYEAHMRDHPYIPIIGRETLRQLNSGGTIEELAQRVVALEQRYQRPRVPPIRRRFLDHYITGMYSVPGFPEAINAGSQACVQTQLRTSPQRPSYGALEKGLYPLPLLLTCCQVFTKAFRVF